jgi:hypothetical protein
MLAQDYSPIAVALVKGPILKARPLGDGSLVVITQAGQKFIFSPSEVAGAAEALKPVPKVKAQAKPMSKPAVKPAPKRAPSKAENDAG